MGRLENEARTVMMVLLKQGHWQGSGGTRGNCPLAQSVACRPGELGSTAHDWLKREHDYDRSLKSVQRYW